MARETQIITDQQRREWQVVPDSVPATCDALVVGAGLSSCAAALTIARAGYDVVMVEPTHMVGGQATAAGVSAFDITFQYDHAINDYGIWGELVDRIIALYRDHLRRPVNVGHYNDNSITPNVCAVERVLTEMLGEAGISVLRNTRVTGISINSDKSVTATTSAGTLKARIVLDGSEDGCGAALAGIDNYIGNVAQVGRQGGAKISAPSDIQDITYTCVIRRYPEGIPEDLRLRQAPPGYEESIDEISKHFPPEGVIDPHLRKTGPHGFAGYRAAPDLAAASTHVGSDWTKVTRTSLNYKNDVATPATYLSDVNITREINRLSIHKTLAILYYLQDVLGLDWSVCTDEGFADGPNNPAADLVDEPFKHIVRHFPPSPYIREARRIIGKTTLTGRMIWRRSNRSLASWDVRSVVTGTYPPDLHGGRGPADFEKHLDESILDKPSTWREGPFPIPLGCFVPAETQSYIALEKNISASRIAASALRMHPTATAVGQAGGTLAKICLKRRIQPAEVPPTAVQWQLAKDGALITPLSIAEMDAADPRYAEVAFAVARSKVSWSVLATAGREAQIATDLGVAYDVGSPSGVYLERWLSSAPRRT